MGIGKIQQDLMNSSVFGVLIYQDGDKIVFANKRFAQILGYDSEEELIGKNALDLVPKDKRKYEEIVRRRNRGEQVVVEHNNLYMLSKYGAAIPLAYFGYTVEYNGKPSGFILVLDKTKEHSYRKLFFALSQINQLIVREDNEQELLRKACDMLVERVGYLVCWVGYIDENKLFRPVYINTRKKELEEVVWKLKVGVDENTPYGKGTVSKAYHTKKVNIIERIFENPDAAYWRELQLKYKIYSACSIPILKKGKVEYILLINDDMPDSFDRDYIHLLEELASDLSFALEKIETQSKMIVLDKAMAASHEWVVITDKDGTILDVNDAVCKISGYTKEELIGKNRSIFKSGYHDKAFYENLWKHLLSGKAYSCRFINKAKDGSIFYLDSNIIPICRNNDICRFVDLGRDVTELVRYQDELEFKSKIYNTLYKISDLSVKVKSEKEFLEKLPKLLVENLDVDVSFVALKRDGGKIEYILGKSKDYIDAVKAIVSEAVKNKDLYSLVPLLKSLKQNGIFILGETEEERRVKELVVSHGFNTGCSMSLVSKGKIIGAFAMLSTRAGVFTPEVKKLLSLIQAQIEFVLDRLESERFSRIVLAALDAGFEFTVVVDSNFNIVYVSKKTVEISGYSEEELIGKHHSIFSSKTYSKEFVKHFYNTLLSGKTFSGPMTYKMKDGSLKDFYVNIAPFFEDGKITHYIAVGKELEKTDELLEQLNRIVHYDPVTGLLNLISFKESIERFMERAKKEKLIGAVAIVNPIEFKKVNEAFGFEVGNSVLRQIAERLRSVLRSYDRVARLESDRFGVLIKDLRIEEDVLIVAAKVLSSLTKAYRVKGHEVLLSFNIGLSIYPRDAKTPEELIDRARVALSDAKSKGENQMGFFKREIEEKSVRKLRLKAELERAIKNKEFIPYYQPYVDKNGTIVGAEALLRWKKNGRIIPPGEFIEYLEQTYLILKAENLIVDTVLQDLKSFNKPVPISINLSVQSINRRCTKDKLISNISRHKVPNNLIKLEIVERVVLNDFSRVQRLIRELRKHSIFFALDDFGTGYSSLSYLSKLDVEILKIDISFVRDLKNQKTRSIVNSIIYLAHSLGMKVTAEGVETKEQFEILKSMGCDYFQGYLFYKPMDKEEFAKLLA